MVFVRRWSKLLLILGLSIVLAQPSSAQLAKILDGRPKIVFTGTTSGTIIAAVGGVTTFSTNGSWTFTTSRLVTVKVTGYAGGAGGRSSVNDALANGGGGGGSGAYNTIGENVQLLPGQNYTSDVGAAGIASTNGGETNFRLSGSTFYMRLGGGTTGSTTGPSAPGGAGGLALGGANSVAGVAGGAAGHPNGANGNDDANAAGSGGGGGDGNFGGVGGVGGNGGRGGAAGETPGHDGGGRGGTGSGGFGAGGGGGGSHSSTGDSSTSVGRTGTGGFLTITIVSIP